MVYTETVKTPNTKKSTENNVEGESVSKKRERLKKEQDAGDAEWTNPTRTLLKMVVFHHYFLLFLCSSVVLENAHY